MSKLLVIAATAADAIPALEYFGLKISDAEIIRNLADIRGHRDMLFIYGHRAYELPEFHEIIEYCISHDMACIKKNTGHDFVAPEDKQQKDTRPHSRACGFMAHAHGNACSPNCPTCHGKEQS